MLNRYALQGQGLVSRNDATLSETLWIDLFEPTAEEERTVETEPALSTCPRARKCARSSPPTACMKRKARCT